MTQDTERLRVFEAVSLLEQCGIQPPMTRKTHGPFRIDSTQWLCNEVEAGRLVFHDYTGLKIEPGAYLGHFGLYDETTNIAQLNTWLASIGHLRRIPETACVPTAAVILERHDEDSRPVFRMPLCPAEVPAELLALPADTFVVCVEESGSMRGAHYTTAAKLTDYIRGRLPAGVPADAPEPACAPAVTVAAPAPAPSASAPTMADREPVAPPAEAVPVQQWTVRKPKRLPGYRHRLHELLKRVHAAGSAEPPTAQDVLDAWSSSRPYGITRVMPDGFEYLDGAGATKEADREALRKAIVRMVDRTTSGR